MLKQPLSEAAISSSGLVPMPSANSVACEYWVLERTPLSVVSVPSPPCRLPFQVAEAFLFIMRADQHWGVRQASTATATNGPISCWQEAMPQSYCALPRGGALRL